MATVVTTYGNTYALPAAPPLVMAPLSLLDLATEFIDNEGLYADVAEANERLASAQASYDSTLALVNETTDPDIDTPAELLAQLESERSKVIDASAWATARTKQVADIARWVGGMTWLPELSNAAGLETWAPDTPPAASNPSGATKNIGSNQGPFAWYDPFLAVGRDDRSTMGYSTFSDLKDRAARALRALRFHEAWQVEHEFWTGANIPTNWHLSASPNTPLTSPHRVITAWSNPTPASGTTLGVAVGLTSSLSSLDQSIADNDAGVGMIHATPFVVQEWSRTYPFIRDNMGRNLTVNGNIIVPGYGYPGTGPDVAAETVADGAFTNGSPNLTSATYGFTTSDIGSTVTSSTAGIPAGAYIIAVTSATVAVLSANATAPGSAASVTVGAGVGSLAGQRFQWAYATDTIYTCKGDIRTYPWDVNQASPLLPQTNSVDVRAERPWATISNQLLRAAVLIDTQAS
jgi:hypothetical protein